MDPIAFRKAMSHYATGVTVVTTIRAGQPHGMTCNSFCSISVHPPLVSVCLTKGTRTTAMIEETKSFVVNILAVDQADLSNRFAGRHSQAEEDRFAGIPWTPAPGNGAPVFSGASASLACEVVREIDAGDHILFFATPLHAETADAVSPLVFHRSKYTGVAT